MIDFILFDWNGDLNSLHCLMKIKSMTKCKCKLKITYDSINGSLLIYYCNTITTGT